MNLKDIYFKFELSYIIIPVFGILYIYNINTRPYLIYFLIYIGLIGTYNTILLKDKILKSKIGKFQYWGSIIFHLILLISLCQFNKFGYPNLISFIIMVISILVLNYIPYWPYYLSRYEMIIFYLNLYIILSLIYFIIKIIN